MKKIVSLSIVIAAFAVLVGFGVNNAMADEPTEVEWRLVGTQYEATAEAENSVIGQIFGEFQIFQPVGDGDSESEVEIGTAFANFGMEVEEDDIKIEMEFEGDVPTEAEAELNMFVDGCGEVSIEGKFEGGEYAIYEETIFDENGMPLEREVGTEVWDIEVREAVICGIDMLSEILGDEGELDFDISMVLLFEPDYGD